MNKDKRKASRKHKKHVLMSRKEYMYKSKPTPGAFGKVKFPRNHEAEVRAESDKIKEQLDKLYEETPQNENN